MPRSPTKRPGSSTKKKPAAKKPAAKKPAAKKPAAKKPAAKKPAPGKPAPSRTGGPVRGIALVDLALAKRDDARPTDPATLARLTLGDRPLTPALRHWLERDGEFFELGEPQSFAEMVESEFGDYLVEAYAPVSALLTEPIMLFEGWGSDSRRFLYLGKSDSHGELPVFTIDNDDGLYVCINGPVDVWLAQQAGALADEHVYGALPEEYEPARMEHAKLSFGGNAQFTEQGFTKRAPGRRA